MVIMKNRFHMMRIMEASGGVGAVETGHHMCAKMLNEKEDDTMQEAAMNMKKYLEKNA